MTFTYPTAADYTAALIQATGDLQGFVDVPLSEGGILSPPVQAHVKSITATIETYAGHDLGSLVNLANNLSALTQATSPLQIVNAIEGLLWAAQDVVDMVVSVIGIAADTVAIVPIVGQAIGAVLQIIKLIIGMTGGKQATIDQCEKDLRRERNDFCKALIQKAADQTAPTSIDPVSGNFPLFGPGDVFRPLAFAYQAGSKQYPPNFTSILLMACGGAAGDFGMSEERYQQIVSQHRKGLSIAIPGAKDLPARPVGTPLAARQRMWSCIKAIMASTRDPHTKIIQAHSDNGQTVMPVLMDIVNNQWWARLEGADHGIDQLFLESLAIESMDWTRKRERCYFMSEKQAKLLGQPAYEMVEDAGCANREREVVYNMVRQLTSPLDGAIRRFHLEMHSRFFDESTGLWKTGVPGGMSRVSQAFEGASGLTRTEAAANARRNLGESYYPTYSQLRGWQKALLAAGTVGAGYLGFEAVRRWA